MSEGKYYKNATFIITVIIYREKQMLPNKFSCGFN